MASLLFAANAGAATSATWNQTTRQLSVAITSAPPRDAVEIPCRGADTASAFTVSTAGWSVASTLRRNSQPFVRLQRSATSSADETVVVQISGSDVRGGLGIVSLASGATTAETNAAQSSFLASREFGEAAPADFSNAAATPTSLSFGSGSNRVTGSIISGTDTRDYIVFTVPAGTELTALYLLSYSPSNLGFNALTKGAVSFDPSTPSTPPPGGVPYGGNHLGTEAPKTNLAGTFAPGVTLTGPGLTFPLAAGTYAYEIQQTSAILTSYILDFTISEPAAAATPSPAAPVWAQWFGAVCLTAAGFVAVRRTVGRRAVVA